MIESAFFVDTKHMHLITTEMCRVKAENERDSLMEENEQMKLENRLKKSKKLEQESKFITFS